MPAFHEGAVGLLLRYSLAQAHLYRWDTKAMRYVRGRRTRGRWQLRALHGTARFLGRAGASDAGIQVLDEALRRWVSLRGEVAEYEDRLRGLRPDVIFCTHQRPSTVLPLVLAARRLGIPTATFIFSWDNLTSKGRIAAPFEHYFVWSPLMRAELLRYYSDVDGGRVHIVGTPQFDLYADNRFAMKREEFFGRIGADPGRPLICYSGGDTTTCPNEPAQLAAVLELARRSGIRRNPQWLFRPSPADSGERFAEVRRRFPELIFAQPQWIYPARGGWTHVVPTEEDARMLANLTCHADVNVNVASTMTLDFALRDKPVVNIGFDAGGTGRARPWLDYYSFEHYRPVVELGAARVARSPEELAEHVNAYLDNPALDREGRRKLVELEVGVPIGRSGETLVAALEGIAAKKEAVA